MITNAHVYLAIAVEAQAESDRLEKLGRRPMPDGQPGEIITYDPEQRSFKNALIAIAFATMFLEAAFYITGVERFGKSAYIQKHDRKTYEEKLRLFGVYDEEIIAAAKHCREVRRDLVHEKAADLNELAPSEIYTAQVEARNALALVKQVAERLR